MLIILNGEWCKCHNLDFSSTTDYIQSSLSYIIYPMLFTMAFFLPLGTLRK